MSRKMVGLLLAVSMFWALVVGSVVGAPGAQACSLVPPFEITDDHLVGDFNAPGSQLQRAYQEWEGDESASITISGVSMYESVYFVAGDDGWTSGSLSVPMAIWGEWPEDTSPAVIEPQRRKEYGDDDCGFDPAGKALGRREYSAETDAYVAFAVDEATLTAAFGAPDTVQRDPELESDLIAQIDAARRNTVGLFIGGGLAAIALAGVVLYMSRAERRSQLHGEATPS